MAQQTFGADSIVKPYPEGILSGEGGQHVTRAMTVKVSTVVKEFSVLVTPRYNATPHADYGRVTPLLAGTDFAVYEIAGIACYPIASVAVAQLVPAWISGGFKFDKIADSATLLNAKAISQLRDMGIIVTDPMLNIGGVA